MACTAARGNSASVIRARARAWAAPVRPGRARSCTHKLELGQRRGTDVGFSANTGRKAAHLGTSACSQERPFSTRILLAGIRLPPPSPRA